MGLAKPDPSSASGGVPQALVSRIDGGHFNSKDYLWARGAFPGANTAEIIQWQEMLNYSRRCAGPVPVTVAAEAKSLGVNQTSMFAINYASDVCAEISIAVRAVANLKSWDEFTRSVEEARPYYSAYMFAVSTAVESISAQKTPRAQLARMALRDQMLRTAIFWGEGGASDAPQIGSSARSVLKIDFERAIRDADHANTIMLKNIVSEQGWPQISRVGREAANNAWLIVQHADDDPLFQVRALRLMKPLLRRAEVNRASYALLYDRVLLVLSGKQYYGTQFTCHLHAWTPLPIDDQKNVDQRRVRMGLPVISEYAKVVVRNFGTRCD